MLQWTYESLANMYIVFEGIIRSGKTTQSKLLHRYLKNRFPKRRIKLTREPGGSQISEAIRKLVQATKFDKEMFPITDIYVYAASRAQALREVVKPALKNKGIVISDRSFITSMAYQGHTQGMGVEKVLEVNKVAIEGFVPDIVFFIDVDPKIALTRNLDIDGDKWESKDLAFFKKARKGYLELKDHPLLKESFVVIDGNQDIKAIHHDIVQVLEKMKF
ncbi:dTMP kinase [candidate division WWE3 bacterium]|jgi:dTMP kinase|nr:dTMP kinase [candidate division WWE3 bacterium]MBT7349384.1 dTMP kinase [candidate division WWE3 bacterium]